MRFQTLEEWLAWQETLHPSSIDLGLERVARVWRRMGPGAPARVAITVGGTNGKGSCVALLDAVLRGAGYRIGTYTSPHLLRYNERVRIRGAEVDDAAWCRAFDRVDRARGDTTLTYFEFGTLAALDLFAGADLDAVVLEVGLGGRLDAVNIVDADVAVVTSVDVDHVEWLGGDRESIGREKAGIFRSGRPAVCGDPEPPATLVEHAAAQGVPLYVAGRDYHYRGDGREWTWWCERRRRAGLPYPALPGEFQLQNAAAALMVLELLDGRLPVGQDAVRRGLVDVRLAGRFEVRPGDVERILDVAHNPHAARALAGALRARPCAGRTLAVVGMLGDKDAHGVVDALRGVVDAWYCGGLEGARGRSGEDLARRVDAALGGKVALAYARVTDAYRAALDAARAGDRVVVFGSFHTIAEVAALDV